MKDKSIIPIKGTYDVFIPYFLIIAKRTNEQQALRIIPRLNWIFKFAKRIKYLLICRWISTHNQCLLLISTFCNNYEIRNKYIVCTFNRYNTLVLQSLMLLHWKFCRINLGYLYWSIGCHQRLYPPTPVRLVHTNQRNNKQVITRNRLCYVMNQRCQSSAVLIGLTV